jgi:hypothetical protein
MSAYAQRQQKACLAEGSSKPQLLGPMQTHLHADIVTSASHLLASSVISADVTKQLTACLALQPNSSHIHNANFSMLNNYIPVPSHLLACTVMSADVTRQLTTCLALAWGNALRSRMTEPVAWGVALQQQQQWQQQRQLQITTVWFKISAACYYYNRTGPCMPLLQARVDVPPEHMMLLLLLLTRR